MREVIAKDKSGVARCWGTGESWLDALNNCVHECYEYIPKRPDINKLYLYMDGEQVVTIGED